MITNGLNTQGGTGIGSPAKTGKNASGLKVGKQSRTAKTASTSEAKLTEKAKKFLESLREINDDFDFIIADEGDDKRALVGESKKEFSVVLTSEELEKMANDEKYALDKIDTIRNIVDMLDRISDRFGFANSLEEAGEDDTVLSKVSVAVNDDGSMTLFADLEKLTAKRKETAEAIEGSAANKEPASIKHVRLSAATEAELIDKISKLDWNLIPDEAETAGKRFDRSI